MPCPGCQWCRSKTVPQFENDDDEVVFWSEHKPEMFGLKERRIKVGKDFGQRKKLPEDRKVSVTMLLDPWLKTALVEQARKRGVGYQTLARMWLAERLQQESKT